MTNPFTEASVSRSSKIINQKWVYDTVPIGFSLGKSCWELYPKANHLMIALIINYI